jgi:hypothetical protein
MGGINCEILSSPHALGDHSQIFLRYAKTLGFLLILINEG